MEVHNVLDSLHDLAVVEQAQIHDQHVQMANKLLNK